VILADALVSKGRLAKQMTELSSLTLEGKPSELGEACTAVVCGVVMWALGLMNACAPPGDEMFLIMLL
jgi:hypothetical protein